MPCPTLLCSSRCIPIFFYWTEKCSFLLEEITERIANVLFSLFFLSGDSFATISKTTLLMSKVFTVKLYFEKIKQLVKTSSYTDGRLPTASFTPPKITLKNREAGQYLDFLKNIIVCPLNIWYKMTELQYKEKHVDMFETFTADHVHKTQLEQLAALTGTAKSHNPDIK